MTSNLDRRHFLTGAAAGAVGGTLAGGSLSGVAAAAETPTDATATPGVLPTVPFHGPHQAGPFHGPHQAGVLTPAPPAFPGVNDDKDWYASTLLA